MRGLFNIDSGVMSFLTKVADIMILNVIFIICCIPIVTIGASTTALYTITLKMVKNEEAYIFTGFFKAFKENFKISTIAWLIAMFMGAVLFADYQLSGTMNEPIATILRCIFFALIIVFFFWISYLFPYIARFENTLKNYLKNAILISIANLPFTLLLTLIVAAIIALFIFVPGQIFLILMTFWIFAGFALHAYINSIILRKVFAKYEPSDEDETNKTEDIPETTI